MPVISEAQRILIVILFHMGFQINEISLDLNLDVRTVKKWLLRYAETGTVNTSYENNRRPRVTNENEDLNIALASIEDSFRTAVDIKTVLEYDVSANTYRRRLSEAGLNPYRAAKKELLTNDNRVNRLNFANNFIDFGIDNWYRTLMVDESTFCTSCYGVILVRRPLGTRFDEEYLQHVQRSGRRLVSVWGVLTGDGLGPLIRIDGRFTAERYTDLLEDHVITYINDFYTQFMNNGENIFWLSDYSPGSHSKCGARFFCIKYKCRPVTMARKIT
jgi:transposase